VRSLAIASDVVYVGGGFTIAAGESRNRIAALSADTALASSWNPDAYDSVLALATTQSTVFAGGSFPTMGGVPQSNLAAIVGVLCAPVDPGVSSGTVSGPTASSSGDFDGDGKLDLALATSGGAQVLSNLGDARFTSAAILATGGGGRGIASADFNADGLLDLALTTSTGLHVMPGLGSQGVPNGTFGPATTYSVGGTGAAAIGVGDLDEDGVEDLVVAVTGTSNLAVLRGRGSSPGIGDGTFFPPTYFGAGGDAGALSISDLDQNGIWDVIVGNSEVASVSVLRGGGSSGVGNATFGAPESYPLGGVAVTVATGDFNEDGVVDLAVGTSAPSRVDVLFGQTLWGAANGVFGDAIHYPAAGSFAGALRALEVADFDADGRADLGLVFDDGRLQYLYGDGVGSRGNGGFVIGSSVVLGGALSSIEVNAFDTTVGAPTPLVLQSNLDQIVAVAGACIGGQGRTLELTTPNGGEAVALGADVPIQWRAGPLVTAVHVEISRDDGGHWRRLASNLTGSSYSWRVTPPGSPHARLRVIDASMCALADGSNGSFTMTPLVGVSDALPSKPSFSLAYPNPSRGLARFDLRLPAAGEVSVEVFDLAGRRVHTLARGMRAAGHHSLSWDGRTRHGRCAAGVYFVRARTTGLEIVRRVVRIE
jgi:hypothetical protein